MKAQARQQWSRLLDAGLILALAVVGPALAIRIGLQPRDPLSGVAVVFPPWTTEESAIARATSAGASLVRLGGFSSVVVVRPDDPAYIERVFADGALLVLDPKVLAACAALINKP
jgi:hypothetical protein